jgi:hypothetical protein
MLKTILEISKTILEIKREESRLKSISNKEDELQIKIQLLELKSKEQSAIYFKLMQSVEKNVTDNGLFRKILTDALL